MELKSSKRSLAHRRWCFSGSIPPIKYKYTFFVDCHLSRQFSLTISKYSCLEYAENESVKFKTK